MKLALTYAILALIATVANIASQELSLRIYEGPRAIALSVLAGTATGLALKYILDKRYIFRFRANDALHDGQTFALYVLMGVFTTAIFWGFEFAFHHLFETRGLRYLGGAIGLAIGYGIKYRLDKHYVFRTRA